MRAALPGWIERLRLPAMEGRNPREAAALSVLFTLLAVATTAIVLYGAYYGGITALLLRSMFFSGVAAAGLLLIGARVSNAVLRLGCYLLAVFALVPAVHLQQSYFEIILRGAISTALDEWIFLGLLAVVVVLVRMTLGWALLVLMALALAYARFGDLIPGQYGHGGYDLSRLTSTLFLSTEGFFGLPMGVAVEYIFLFALLGTLLMKIGSGGVFVDLARGVTGHVQGGPGLSAAASSALMGTINGSAVANVVTTGTFTIPLMKRAGYTPNVAGAIEAAASSAGQILPPIMGAAAFLMAEIIGVPYRTIALAALIPGLLYVLALIVAVRLEAGRLGLARDPGAGGRLLREALGRSYLLLPLIGLIVLLFAGYTPTRAAVYCLLIGLLIMPWHRDTRIGPLGLLEVCRDTLVSTLPIVAAVAAAGAVIGVLNLTGLGLMLSGLILDLGDGRLWLILVLTALASFLLGMGLPTSAAYLLLAVLVAPALTRLGIEPIVAHMFIFYYGLVSAITPPVALAAYAAASIAGGEPNRTALESIRLGFVKLLVPFLFITMPGLLLVGTGTEIALSVLFASLGVVGLTVALSAWLVCPLAAAQRWLMAAGALLVLWPSDVVAADPVTVAARLAGLAILGITLGRPLLRAPRVGRYAN